jgi:L-alanine-DL-glutamate epimerase-like enolase superfamily enzyme
VFTISRGARTVAHVIVVEITDGHHTGRGECVPYPRYGETPESVMRQLEALSDPIARGLDRRALQTALPAGAARNALDCALWDLTAKVSGTPAWQLARLPAPTPLTSAFTIGLADADEMGHAARPEAGRPVLKLKLGGAGDVDRVEAVHRAAPMARLIVDANEAWDATQFSEFAPALARLGVEMIEQPLPADEDHVLADLAHPVPVCADESCHTSDDIATVGDRYEVVNLKLDKAGGLTEALQFIATARAAGLGLMVGCMVGTSLGMAPAMLVGGTARYIDLDAPLWMAEDREHAIRFDGSLAYPPTADLWG